jgi:hypothetical protein
VYAGDITVDKPGRLIVAAAARGYLVYGRDRCFEVIDLVDFVRSTVTVDTAGRFAVYAAPYLPH